MEKMDFHAMKRKKLQALCKKHGIPANLKNVEMAERLSFIFKGKENSGFGSDNAGNAKGGTFGGVSGKDLQNVIILDSDSSIDTSNIQMVASDIVAGDVVDSWKENFESVGMISPGPDLGQKSLEEDQVVLAPSVATEEFGDCLMEEIVEKLDDKTDVNEDVNGTRMVAAEAEKQDLTNNLQGSNINHGNLLHASPEKSSGDLVEEGEVCQLDDNISVDGAVFNDRNNISESVTGTAIRTEDTCEAKFVSSQQLVISPASEKMIGFSPKQIHDLEPPIEADIAMFDVEENMPVVVNKDLVDNSQEVLHAEPSVVVMNEKDLVQVNPEEFGKHFEEGEIEELNDKIDLLDDVCETGEGGDEAVEQGCVDSLQGSNINDMNLFHVSPEESEQVHKSDDNIRVNSALDIVGNERSEADTSCLDISKDAKNTDGKTNLRADNFLDEVHAFSLKYSDGTPNQFLLTSPSSGVKSCDLTVHKIVASGTAAGHASACEAKFVSSPKISSSPEERIDSSPILLENSQIKRFDSKANLSPGNRNDHGFFSAEENMQINANKGGDITELHPAAPSVTSEEFLGCLLEEKVEKFDNKTDVHGDVCGTGMGAAEAEMQDLAYKPQGSNINHGNLLHFFPEKSSGSLVEEELHKLDDNICVHVAVSNDKNNISEAVTMCVDALIGAKDNVSVEQILEEAHSSSLQDSEGTPVQFPPTYPGTAAGNAYVCEAKFVSSQKISSSQEERIDSSPILLDSSQIKRLDSKANLSPENRNELGLFYVEQNMQTNVNKEQGGDIKEFHPAAPSVTSDEFGDYLVEEKVEKLDNKTDVHGDVCGPRMVAAETEKHDLPYNPQGSNINHENLLHVSPEKFSGSLVEEGEVSKLDDASIDSKDNVSVKQFLDEAHSSIFQDSEGTPVQFPPTYPGTAIRTEDKCEGKFVSPQKLVISPASEKVIGFCPKQIHNIGTPIEDDIAMFDVEQNMQVGINNEQVEEFGKHLVEGEVEELGEKFDLLDDVCGAGDGGDETVKQGGVNSPQGSTINDVNFFQVSPEESSHLLVEQVQKSDDNDFHGSFYNLGNSESEVDILRLLDETIAAMDTDGKTNVTAEHFPDEVHSSSFEYSDGTTDQFFTTLPQGEMMSIDPNIHQMVTLDTCEEMCKSAQKEAIIADPEECIGFFPNNLEASATKGFQAKTRFGPSTLGDVVGALNMKESTRSYNMEKESFQKECNLVQGEVSKMFDNSDVHDDAGGTGAEEENLPNVLSHKRKRSDMNSNEFEPVDDASGQNSHEKLDEFVPTMSQPGEMKSYTSNISQSFASDTGYGDEVTYKEKLESSPKFTPTANSDDMTFFSPEILESSMMNKENINIDKKEQVGTVTTKNKFQKRQPLQDLQQK